MPGRKPLSQPTMKRVIKPEGLHRIEIEEVPVPEPGPGEVRVKAACSLISRGSELGGRYTREHAVSPDVMGYSMAGTVDAVGEGLEHLEIGDGVVALAPHAQYVVRPARLVFPWDQTVVMPMAEGLSFDTAPYYPLTAGAVTWVEVEDIQPQDTVAVLGQGLVGNLILQVIKANGAGRVVAVDALENRCAMAAEFGADVVVNAREEDPVKAVRRLTNGLGADVVVYAVGGPAGPAAFEQGLDMLALGGLFHLIGLYEHQPLPLFSEKIQGRKLLGGYYRTQAGARQSRRAMELLAAGAIRTGRMTTHRFPWHQAADAFALLYEKPGEALGVLLDWRD